MPAKRRRMLIVDGYNVLRSGSRYNHIAFPDYTDDYFNRAREKLINDIIDYAGRDTEAVIVYDAAERVGSFSDESRVGGVRIIFSPPGQSADHVIEKLAHDARERNIEATVVSSDATIQDTVFAGTVCRMSAQGFCQAITAAHEVRVERESQKVSKKNTLAERISPEMREKLERLRDGLGS